MDKTDYSAMIKKWIDDSVTILADSYSRAGLATNYKHGRQWEEQKYNALQRKGIVPITVNRCLPVINTVSGIERQNRQDIRVFPRKYGNDQVAGVYTELIKFTKDYSNGNHIFSESFANALVTGQDFIDMDVYEDRFDGGSLVMKRYSIFDAVIDPLNVTYDLNGSGRYIGLKQRVPKQEAMLLYGDKIGNSGEGSWTINDHINNLMGYLLEDNSLSSADDQFDPSLSEAITHIQKETYLIYKFWWKEPVAAYRWTDKENGQVMLLVDKKDISKAKKATKAMPERFDGKDIISYSLHRTYFCDGMIIKDDVVPFGDKFNIMPVIRISPYYDNGYAYGLIDNIIGIQDEVNLNRTAGVRSVTKGVNGGFKVNGGSPAAISELEMFGSTPGKVWDKSKYGGSIEEIQPTLLNQGYIQLSELASTEIKEITGVNDQMHGYDSGRVESGKAIELKRRQGITATETVMDNRDRSFVLFGGYVIEFVRNTDVYTDNEILDIIGKSSLINNDSLAEAESKIGIRPPKPYIPPAPDENKLAMVDPMSQQVVMNEYKKSMVANAPEIQRWLKAIDGWEKVVKEQAKRDLLEAIKSDRVGIYGVKVETAPDSPTVTLSNTAELIELAKAYPGSIPLQTMIKNSSISNKDEILEDINQQQQMMIQAAQQQQAQQPAQGVM